MYQTQPVGFAASDDTWIVVANRKGARILASDGGVKNLRVVQEMPHPEGRLKNRELETDRASGASMAEGGANYPVHGMVNKNEAIFHVMQVFVREIARMLQKARAENAYSRLVLVTDPRFLGELRASLDVRTRDRITRSIEKDLYDFDLPQLKERIAADWLSG